MTYEQYLKSEYWQEIKKRIHRLRGGRCEVCKSTDRLHVHHKKYRRNNEKTRHLSLLCDYCHSEFHKRFGMTIKLSKGVFKRVRKELVKGNSLEEAWAVAGRNFGKAHEKAIRNDARQRRKKAEKAARIAEDRKSQLLWRMKYEVPLEYYLERDD